MPEDKKCVRCSVILPITHFQQKRSGNYKKTCEYCLQKRKEYTHRQKEGYDERPSLNKSKER